jgi:type I restriction enzyme S subunit
MTTIRWGDIATLEYGKALRDYPAERSESDCFPVFGTNGPIGWTSQKLSDEAGVIVGRKGAYRGIHYSSEPFFVIDTAYYLRPRDSRLDLRWAYYKLLTVNLDQVDVGAAIPTTNREAFYALPVEIPSVEAQREAASILSAYDDAIENNRRRMGMLEKAARLLYEEWFVRLRFPGHEHTPITNGLPQGWEKTPLRRITTKIGSGATPRGGSESYKSEGITLIRSLNVYDDRFEEDGLAYIDDEQAAELENVIVESQDILLNITGASVARCCMAPERFLPARVNQHVMIVRVDPEKADPFLVHSAINSDERKRQLLSYAQKGSTREALTKEMVGDFEITRPSDALMRQFGEVAKTCFLQRENLALQNQKLRVARDLLLPRLMSGEIEV